MKKCLVFIIFLFFLMPVQTLADPTSHIDETVTADFYMNGTMKGSVQRIGRASISVGNNQDVLQYLEVAFSGTGNTDLQSTKAYRSTAASPYVTDKTNFYVNTTADEEALYYTVDSSKTPVINLSMTYENEDGGIDIHSDLNTLNFTINLTSDTDMNVDFHFQVEKDIYGGNDAMNIITSGMSDTDGDGIYDRFEWSGDLVAGVVTTLNFEGEIQPGVNFNNATFTSVDLAGDSGAYYAQPTTFSEIIFQTRFSRGPIRQGVDIAEMGNWCVRGFLKNVAFGLRYQVAGWEIYEVGETTPLASSSVSETLYPEDILYTNRYDTGKTEKKYYSSLFDWEIIWGDSYYSGETTSTIDMPLLYMIDSHADKFVIIDQNDESGRVLTLNDTVEHMGASQLGVDVMYVNSTIPHLSQEGYATQWSISDIEVFYRSGGNETDVTALASISSSGSTTGSDGYINVLLTSADLGEAMQLGDELVLRYKISSSSYSENSKYLFATETVLITESGTPDYDYVEKEVDILGVGTPESPGGGGGGAEEDAWIMAEDARAYVIMGNLANVKITYRIYDTGTKGLRDMGLMVLIPEGGELLKERTDLELMRKGKWEKLSQGRDYIIKYVGLVPVGDKNYNQYIIDFLLDGGILNLYNQDKIRIEYKTELPYGMNELVTEASGYNYYRDKIVSEAVHSFIRIMVKVSKFTYSEEGWEQGLAEVGNPVRWLKEFRLKNPNDMPAEDSFVTTVFKDSLNARIVTEDGESRPLEIMPDSKVSWDVRLEAQEEKSFYLQVFTPPVIEILKTVTPLLSNETWVSFDMNSTVQNFAEEKYRNVTYSLPYPIENILDYRGVEDLVPKVDGTAVIIGDMLPDENRSFYLRYVQKPPILIVTMNGFNFTNTDIMNVKILVIPTEKEERGYVEMEAIGPYVKTESGEKLIPKTNYGDAMSVEGVKGSINEFNISIGLENFVPGKYVLVTNFKKDFAMVLMDEKEFHVGGGKLLFEIGYNGLILALLVFILFMFGRIYRKKEKFKEELRKLRREI